MPFPRPTSDEARIRGQKGHETLARKREAQKVMLWRRLVRGEALKVAAYHVGISYGTAKTYRREA